MTNTVRLAKVPARAPLSFDLASMSRFGIVLLALIGLVAALSFAQVVLAPVVAAIVVGLMLGPVAGTLDRLGFPPALSAGVAVILFILLFVALAALLAMPLTEWLDRLPVTWDRLQAQIVHWRELFNAIGDAQDELKSSLGNSEHLVVTVDEGGEIEKAAGLAPAMLGQVALFLVGMFLFLANREALRVAILRLCLDRRLRWRTAHVFADVETRVSRYLLSITAINVALGLVVTLVFWLAGIPSPLLWGLLAGLTNYVAFIGQGFMFVLLIGDGLSRGTSLLDILLPAGLFAIVSFIESQLVTPHVIGRIMTINPFAIFLAVTFGLWLWGPLGGFIAVPVLVILKTVLVSLTRPGTHAGTKIAASS